MTDFASEREAMVERQLRARGIADQIRDLVKSVYGDEFDCVVTNTAEAGLRLAYEVLMAPPVRAHVPCEYKFSGYPDPACSPPLIRHRRHPRQARVRRPAHAG